MRSIITVGMTDTLTGRAALRWALRQAARSDRAVLLLHVVPDRAKDHAALAAAVMLRRMAGEAAGLAPLVPVSSRVLHGAVVAQLAAASDLAAMLVVGSDGRGSAATSIGRASVTAAAAPLVVVPATDRLFAHGVVVGVDDSAAGWAALAFAAAEASSTRQRLTLLGVRTVLEPADESLRATLLDEAARRAADGVLAAMGRTVRQRYPGLAVDTRSLRGLRAQVLIESSANAQLLVLGAARTAVGQGLLSEVRDAGSLVLKVPTALVHGSAVGVPAGVAWEDALSEGWAETIHPFALSGMAHRGR